MSGKRHVRVSSAVYRKFPKETVYHRQYCHTGMETGGFFFHNSERVRLTSRRVIGKCHFKSGLFASEQTETGVPQSADLIGTKRKEFSFCHSLIIL